MRHERNFLFMPLLLAACVSDLSIPSGTEISCASDSNCPREYLCRASRCVRQDASLAPTVSIESVAPATTADRPLVGVRIAFTVADSDEDLVDLQLQYTLQAHSVDAEWFDGTVVDESSHTGLLATVEGLTRSLIWDALADARGDGQLKVESIANGSDGSAVSEVVGPQAAVAVRLIPRDSRGVQGRESTSPAFSLGNAPPVAVFEEVLAPTGVVPLGIRVTDLHGDPASITVEFRVNDVKVDPTNAWRPANITLGETEGVGSSPDGAITLLLWETRSALAMDSAAPQQGVGNVSVSSAQVRVRAVDEVDNGILNFGPWSQWQAPLTIINQTPPRIEGVTVRRAEIAAGGPVAIRYRLVDDESDPSDIRVDYAHDADTAWSPCQEYAQPQSEGLYDLASAPAGVDGEGGVLHTFVWDPSAQGFRVPSTTRLRLRVTDGRSSAVNSVEVQLLHAIGPVGRAPNAAAFAPSRDVALPAHPVYGSSLQPSALVTADFNGDGFADIAMASHDADEIAVMLGDGAGGVVDGRCGNSSGCSYATASGPASLVVGDFNGDDVLDLAVANSGADTVSIFTGNGTGGMGDGTFTWLGDFSTVDGPGSRHPVAIAAADLNADGILDLMVTNAISEAGQAGTLNVLLGNGTNTVGDGTFGGPTAYPSGHGPIALAVADLNGDGFPDVATANRDSDNVAIHLGAGDGTLLPAGLYSVQGSLGASITVEDFNGDGWPDILLPDLGGRLLTLLGFGDGTFSIPLSTSVGRIISKVAVADFNGDGISDVAAIPLALSGDGSVSVMLGVTASGVPTGTFSPAADFALPYPAVDVTVVDADADGLIDIVTVNRDSVSSIDSRTLSVLVASKFVGVSQSGFASPVRTSLGTTPSSLILGDAEHDGILDLIVASNGSSDVQVLSGSGSSGIGDGTFLAPSTLQKQGGAMHVLRADLNLDGIADLIFVQSTGHELAVMVGQGAQGIADGTFAPQVTYDLTDPITDLGIGDFTADNVTDLAVLVARPGNSADEVLMMIGQGDGSFVMGAVLATDDGATSLVAEDLNGDTILDLAVSDADDDVVRLFFGNATSGAANGTFAEAGAVPTGAGPDDVLATDCNGDGVWDLIVANKNSMSFSVLVGGSAAGKPDGSYVGADACSGCTYSLPGEPSSLAVADLNIDGRTDIVVVGRASGVVWIHAGIGATLGSCSYGGSIQVAAGQEPASVVVADLNNDSLPDLLVRSIADSSVSVVLGQSDDFYARWTFPAKAYSASATLLPPEMDRFGIERKMPTLSVHRYSGEGSSNTDELRRTLLNQGLLSAGQKSVSAAWLVRGDVRWTRLAGEGAADGGAPLRVESRFGARRDPESTSDFGRAGLDMQAAERGIVIELQLNAPGAALRDIKLLHRRSDWRRASADASAADYDLLPRAITGNGESRDVLIPEPTWVSVPRVDDLSSGDGPRFVADGASLRVVTDRLGVFWAFENVP